MDPFTARLRSSQDAYCPTYCEHAELRLTSEAIPTRAVCAHFTDSPGLDPCGCSYNPSSTVVLYRLVDPALFQYPAGPGSLRPVTSKPSTFIRPSFLPRSDVNRCSPVERPYYFTNSGFLPCRSSARIFYQDFFM